MNKISPAMQAMYDRAKRKRIVYWPGIDRGANWEHVTGTAFRRINLKTFYALRDRGLLRLVDEIYPRKIYVAKETD